MSGRIAEIHKDSLSTYGSPRVHAQLRSDGHECGKNRVARLMQAHGLVGKAPRRFKRTTFADKDARSTAVDLV
ncbi:MAG: IS3 family transposase, partial [Candidatus Limnocylindria bacterium]